MCIGLKVLSILSIAKILKMRHRRIVLSLFFLKGKESFVCMPELMYFCKQASEMDLYIIYNVSVSCQLGYNGCCSAIVALAA